MEGDRIINIWSSSQHSSCDRTHGCHQVLMVTPTLHLAHNQNIKGRLKGTTFPKKSWRYLIHGNPPGRRKACVSWKLLKCLTNTPITAKGNIDSNPVWCFQVTQIFKKHKNPHILAPHHTPQNHFWECFSHQVKHPLIWKLVDLQSKYRNWEFT